jgi:hypothetical protein
MANGKAWRVTRIAAGMLVGLCVSKCELSGGGANAIRGVSQKYHRMVFSPFKRQLPFLLRRTRIASLLSPQCMAGSGQAHCHRHRKLLQPNQHTIAASQGSLVVDSSFRGQPGSTVGAQHTYIDSGSGLGTRMEHPPSAGILLYSARTGCQAAG